MQKFELVLRNEKQKLYNRFAIFIFLLNGIGISVALLYSQIEIISQNGALFFIGPAVILISYPMILLFFKEANKYLKSLLIASFAISLYWTWIGYWWVGVFTFVLILLFVISQRKLKVEVDIKKIQYPSFPAKTIKWDELNNLVLKDGLLTIDFKNNKIIQQLINGVQIVNEKEFNDFCRQQLSK